MDNLSLVFDILLNNNILFDIIDNTNIENLLLICKTANEHYLNNVHKLKIHNKYCVYFVLLLHKQSNTINHNEANSTIFLCLLNYCLDEYSDINHEIVGCILDELSYIDYRMMTHPGYKKALIKYTNGQWKINKDDNIIVKAWINRLINYAVKSTILSYVCKDRWLLDFIVTICDAHYFESLRFYMDDILEKNKHLLTFEDKIVDNTVSILTTHYYKETVGGGSKPSMINYWLGYPRKKVNVPLIIFHEFFTEGGNTDIDDNVLYGLNKVVHSDRMDNYNLHICYNALDKEYDEECGDYDTIDVEYSEFEAECYIVL
jgi:hypothetical protein